MMVQKFSLKMDIVTTINVNLYDIAESALLRGLESNDADNGLLF